VTSIAFYHLQRSTLEVALPKLLEKVLENGMRALVMAGSDERVEALNTTLWTYDSQSFLPHGSGKDGAPETQPILLTADVGSSPHSAEVLVQLDGTSLNDFSGFDRVLDVFDGNDGTALTAARERWKSLKSDGHDLTYWQQSDSGGWQKKDTD
jgi:DNA polymerase III subunit chi